MVFTVTKTISINQVKTTNEGSRFAQYFATLTVTLTTFSYGIAVGWSSNALPYLQSNESPLKNGKISNAEAAWLASLLCLSAFPATPLFSYLCARFGCKFTGYIVSVSFVLSWIMVFLAENINTLYASKFVVGIASGGVFILCSTYVRDVAEENMKGTLSVFITIFNNLGLLYAYVIGGFCSYKTVAILSALPSILFLVIFFFLPETPIHLLRQKKYPEAEKALQWLRGRHANISQELQQLNTSLILLEAEDMSNLSIKDLFHPRCNFLAFVIAMTLFFNQQLCGRFCILNYTVKIFQESGSDLSPNMSSIVVAIMSLGGSYLSSFLVERAGRKVLLLISEVFVALSLGTLGLHFFLKAHDVDVSYISWLPVTCLSVYIIAMAIGLHPMPYVLLGDIFNDKIRDLARSFAIGQTWIIAFSITQLFSLLSDKINIYGCFWIFGSCCVLGAIFVIYFVPETNGRTLESIQQELEGKKQIRI